jgi:tol-pal system protein YbgF
MTSKQRIADMRNRSAVAAIVLTASLLAPRAADAAANKEHQQIMAELRMLQEQQSQLLRGIEGLNEQLRLITTKIDDQTGTTRKAFADQKLLIDGVAEASRILREKADDTNVRLSTMTQEMQALRQTIASMPAPTAAAPVITGDPATVDPNAPPPTPTAPVAPPPNVSPTQMFERVSADYAAGQYDLAIEGFQAFIRTFPTSPQADDAQLYIGNSYQYEGKFKEALQAYQKVITDYPQADTVPNAWFKTGQTYENLQQPDLARKAYDTVIKQFPTVMEATLAKQRLDGLNRKR